VAAAAQAQAAAVQALQAQQAQQLLLQQMQQQMQQLQAQQAAAVQAQQQPQQQPQPQPQPQMLQMPQIQQQALEHSLVPPSSPQQQLLSESHVVKAEVLSHDMPTDAMTYVLGPNDVTMMQLDEEAQLPDDGELDALVGTDDTSKGLWNLVTDLFGSNEIEALADLPANLGPGPATKRSLTEDSDALSEASTFQAAPAASALFNEPGFKAESPAAWSSVMQAVPPTVPSHTPPRTSALAPGHGGLRDCFNFQGDGSKGDRQEQAPSAQVRTKWAPIRWMPGPKAVQER